jgi:8-oxo-dGTP pyrophosphatase MutT (NUDIX family)
MDRALRRRALQKALRVSAIVDADELLEALERLLEEETGIVGR